MLCHLASIAAYCCRPETKYERAGSRHYSHAHAQIRRTKHKMEVIMTVTLAIVSRVSVSRNSLLLRCGDVEPNPGPVGRYSGIKKIVPPEVGQAHF